MKKLMEWLQDYAQKSAASYIKNNKEKISKKIADKIDIPLLSEKDEKKLILAIISALEEAID